MLDSRVNQDLEQGAEHSSDYYVRQCAESDIIYYILRGKELPEEYYMEVFRAGDFKSLRIVRAIAQNLLKGLYNDSEH